VLQLSRALFPDSPVCVFARNPSERSLALIKSVANITRRDIAEFLPIAAGIPIRPVVETFPLERANEALRLLSVLIEDSYCLIAPKRLSARIESPRD
jgi:D-arabinose 1-dehydrogenase-like Zn-dependent alcohol dehydrogenase